MAEDNNNNGGLRQAFGELKGSVENFQRNWEKQDKLASDGRRYLYEKMATVERSNIDLSYKVDNVALEVQEMKPAVKDWVNTKNQFIGGRVVVGVFIGGIISAGAYLIAHFSTAVLH